MNIRVDDPIQVKNCGTEITRLGNDYNTEIKNVYKILDDLSNTWTGTRSQTFQNKMEKCRTEFENFGKNLINFGELVSATGEAYNKIENES